MSFSQVQTNTSKRKKLTAVIIGITSVLLTIIAVGVSFYLQTRGTRPTAPTAPESKPSAYEPNACALTFQVFPLTCYSGTCNQDHQCATGLVCDSELKVCVNPDCPENNTCLCQFDCDTHCTFDSQCQSANPDYICYELADGTSACRHQDYPVQTDCAPPEYTCDSPCTSDDQCQSANPDYICSSSSNTCRHQDYPDSQTCTPPEPTTYECNSPCTTDEQCQTASQNYICNSRTNTCRLYTYPDQSNCQPPTGGVNPTPTPTSPTPSPTTPTTAQTNPTPQPSSASPLPSPQPKTQELPAAGGITPTISALLSGAILLILGTVIIIAL